METDARRRPHRRWRVVAVIAVVAGSPLLAGVVGPWTGQSESRQDPDGVAVGTPSGRAPTGEELPTGKPPAAVLDTLSCWADDVWIPSTQCIAWTVADDDGAVFTHVATSGTVVVTATARAVTAFDAGTGRHLWDWEDPSDSAPSDLVVSNSTAVVIYEGDHQIVVLDLFRGAADGAWSVPITEKRQAWVALEETTLVVREPTTVSVYRAGTGPAGPMWQLLSRPTWVQPIEPAPGGVPVITEDRVVAVTPAGLSAWDRADGQLVWQRPGTPTRAPVPVGDLLVVASQNMLTGIASTDGTVRWEQPHDGNSDLVALGNDQFGVVSATTIEVHDGASGEPVVTLEPGGIDAVEQSRPGELFVAVGSTLQRWSIELAGPTWTLGGIESRSPDRRGPMFRTAEWGRTLVAAVGGGSFLAALDLPRDPPTADVDVECPDARPSRAMGALTAWQGRHAHVAVPDSGASEVWIGLPGHPASTSFTLEAQLAGSTMTARFAAHADQTPTERLELDRGGRASGGFPSHWVVLSDFPVPGCWEVTITAEEFTDTVTLPVGDTTADS